MFVSKSPFFVAKEVKKQKILELQWHVENMFTDFCIMMYNKGTYSVCEVICQGNPAPRTFWHQHFEINRGDKTTDDLLCVKVAEAKSAGCGERSDNDKFVMNF